MPITEETENEIAYLEEKLARAEVEITRLKATLHKEESARRKLQAIVVEKDQLLKSNAVAHEVAMSCVNERMNVQFKNVLVPDIQTKYDELLLTHKDYVRRMRLQVRHLLSYAQIVCNSDLSAKWKELGQTRLPEEGRKDE